MKDILPLLLALLLAAMPVHATDLIYLNRCAGGCTVTVGIDDAINHVSSIPNGTSQLVEFSFADSTFVATLGCLRNVFSKYDVKLVADDPGQVPRREILLAGSSQNIGLPAGFYSVAPIYSEPRDNALVFVFAETIGDDSDVLCEEAARNVAYLYTLENVLYCQDVVAPATGCGVKTFTDIDAQCGETTPRPCLNGASTQNSAAALAVTPGLGDRLLLSDFERAMPSP